MPSGKIIVVDIDDCERTDNSQANNGGDSGTNQTGDSTTMMIMFSGGAFILAIISVLIVLLKTCLQQYTNRPNGLCLQATTLITFFDEANRFTKCDNGGNNKDGYEWIEWPETRE